MDQGMAIVLITIAALLGIAATVAIVGRRDREAQDVHDRAGLVPGEASGELELLATLATLMMPLQRDLGWDAG